MDEVIMDDVIMGEVIKLLGGLVLIVAGPAIVTAPLLMSKSLTFFQSFRILAAGFAAMMVMSAAFFFALSPVLGNAANGVSLLVAVCLAGSLITKLAARKGVLKQGLLGVGAESVLSFFALSLVAVGMLYLAGAF